MERRGRKELKVKLREVTCKPGQRFLRPPAQPVARRESCASGGDSKQGLAAVTDKHRTAASRWVLGDLPLSLPFRIFLFVSYIHLLYAEAPMTSMLLNATVSSP